MKDLAFILFGVANWLWTLPGEILLRRQLDREFRQVKRLLDEGLTMEKIAVKLGYDKDH